MLRKNTIIGGVIAAFLIAGSLLVSANPAVDQIGALSGSVAYMVTSGATVHEGDILVKVNTLAGPVTAARATTNGVVTEVLVKPGDAIKIGDIVARIEVGK